MELSYSEQQPRKRNYQELHYFFWFRKSYKYFSSDFSSKLLNKITIIASEIPSIRSEGIPSNLLLGFSSDFFPRILFEAHLMIPTAIAPRDHSEFLSDFFFKNHF